MLKIREEPVWCSRRGLLLPGPEDPLFRLDEDEVQALKRALRVESEPRRKAFLQLMEPTDGGTGRNLDFVSNFSAYFNIDIDCICQELLIQDQEDRADFAFSVGKMLARGKVGEAFLLNYNENYLIMKSIRGVVPKEYLSLRVLKVSDNIEALSIMNPGLEKNVWTKKQTGSPKLIAVGGDNFSNQTCLHMILNTILKNNPNYVYQYDAFYCGDGGYNVTEFATQGDLSSYLDRVLEEDITEEFLRDLFTQVLKPLSVLKSDLFSFVHADLKARNVFVTLNVEGAPIYQIADFDKSSIFWKGLRFYNNTGDYRLSNLPFDTKIYNGERYYIIDNAQIRAGLPIQVYTMHNPYGFYLSYDLYTFFYSLMMEPAIWKFIWNSYSNNLDSGVLRAWELLWFPDQFPDVMKRIQKTHEKLRNYPVGSVDYKNQLATMRSIRTISNTFYRYGYRLKVDTKDFYSVFGLRVRGVKQPLKDRTVEISKDGHICVESCRSSGSWLGGSSCKTNKYSKLGIVYESDSC